MQGGGLIVRFDEQRAGVAKSADAAVAQWFSQDIFQDENIEDADEDAEAVLAQRQGAAGGKRGRGGNAAEEAERGGRGDAQPPAAAEQQQQQRQADEAGASSGSDAEGEPGTAAAKRRRTVACGGRCGGAAALGLSADALAGPENGFEVVPAQESGSDGSDSEDEFEALDDVAKVGAPSGRTPQRAACGQACPAAARHPSGAHCTAVLDPASIPHTTYIVLPSSPTHPHTHTSTR